MALVANNPEAAKRLGIPSKVGKEFMKADKGRKFGSGGPMKESKAMMKKEVSFMKKKGAPKSMIKHEEAEMEGKKMRKFAAGGMTAAQKAASSQRIATKLGREYQGYKPGGDPRAAQRAVMASPPRPSAPVAGGAANPVSGMGAAGGTQAMMRKGGSVFRKGADGVAHKGKTKGTMVKMREGGSVFRKGADGIASKGKTKGTMVKMNKGGYC